MRFLILALAVLSLAVPSFAGDCAANLQGGSCSANLQANYVAPVQQLAVQAYVAPVQQVRVVQRVVQPQAVVLQQKVYAAPVVQQQVVTPYVQQSLAVSSYGSANLAVGRPLAIRQRLAVGAPQRVVTKSKTVTSTGRGGLLGRLLGR
jgi:hypothetical protein